MVLDGVDDREDQQAEQPTPQHFGPYPLSFFPPAGMPCFLFMPPFRAPRELHAVLNGQGYHCHPELAVVAAVELEVNHVPAPAASVAPPSPRRVDVEAGGFVLVVWQGASAREPRPATERPKFGVTVRDLLDGDGFAHGLAALAEPVSAFRQLACVDSSLRGDHLSPFASCAGSLRNERPISSLA